MNRKYISFLFYIIACLFIFIYLISESMSNFNLSEMGRLFLLCGSCFFLYIGGFLLSKHKSNNKPMKINLWIFFFLYLILLVTLTLFDVMWGRNGFTFVSWSSEKFFIFVKESVNFVPFKTIITFVKQFNSMYDNRTVLLNLFGNFIALMPMTFFLQLLYKKQQKFSIFIITIFLIVFGIEITQLLTASGRFDIDDFILNISGAVLMYFILKIKDVNKLIKNIFLLENNKISKKSIILIFMSLLLVIVVLIGVYKYRNKLYNDNNEKYFKLHNPLINFVVESGVCDDSFEPFYENNLSKYYFNCDEKVYIILNNEDKYLVKDVLDGKTDYVLDIYKIKERLDYYGISYTIEEK